MERCRVLREQVLREIEGAGSEQDVEAIRVRALGRKGEMAALLQQLGQAPAERRPALGQAINGVRRDLETALATRRQRLAEAELERRLEHERVDISLPGRFAKLGAPHPLRETLQDLEDIFVGMGFRTVRGPEIESEYLNFEALNIPAEHPARDMQDSFYLSPGWVLRTHTSPVQIRAMREAAPQPIRAICPGRVFRRDDDVTHSPVFHQIEGIMVGEQVTMADLKGTLYGFARALFGPDVRLRLRPSYFPFTEPSAEVDVNCASCGGRGCNVCKHTGWMEILGSGMIHPVVLENGGYDPARFSGFAFGMGVERVTMRRYGISDIRALYSADLRLSAQI